MIKKIISGGQTGTDQAALDAAIKWQVPHGGWVPRGRLTEAGILPDKYHLDEMPSDSYPARTEQNVIDSDGTLILSHGSLTGGSKYTREVAFNHDKPCLHINLNEHNVLNAAENIYDWIYRHEIKILNVAGPKASKDPYIYQATIQVLTAVFHMELIFDAMPDNPGGTGMHLPRTVEEGVDMLINGMSLKDKTKIANMKEAGLTYLHLTLADYMHNIFGPLSVNTALLEDCHNKLGKDNISENEASSLIIRELWKKLRATHVLRVVK